jgi:hypothetical protein
VIGKAVAIVPNETCRPRNRCRVVPFRGKMVQKAAITFRPAAVTQTLDKATDALIKVPMEFAAVDLCKYVSIRLIFA